MTDLQDVLTDMNTDCEEIDQLVAGIDAAQWKLPTPAPGWTIAHQVAHLTATFRMAALAASDPAAFQAFNIANVDWSTYQSQLVQMVKSGDIFLFPGWWPAPEVTAVQQIYAAAGAR